MDSRDVTHFLKTRPNSLLILISLKSRRVGLVLYSSKVKIRVLGKDVKKRPNNVLFFLLLILVTSTLLNKLMVVYFPLM